MKAVWLSLFLLAATFLVLTSAKTMWVHPSGTVVNSCVDTCTSGSPCAIGDTWSETTSPCEIVLKAGDYTGMALNLQSTAALTFLGECPTCSVSKTSWYIQSTPHITIDGLQLDSVTSYSHPRTVGTFLLNNTRWAGGYPQFQSSEYSNTAMFQIQSSYFDVDSIQVPFPSSITFRDCVFARASSIPLTTSSGTYPLIQFINVRSAPSVTLSRLIAPSGANSATVPLITIDSCDLAFSALPIRANMQTLQVFNSSIRAIGDFMQREGAPGIVLTNSTFSGANFLTNWAFGDPPVFNVTGCSFMSGSSFTAVSAPFSINDTTFTDSTFYYNFYNGPVSIAELNRVVINPGNTNRDFTIEGGPVTLNDVSFAAADAATYQVVALGLSEFNSASPNKLVDFPVIRVKDVVTFNIPVSTPKILLTDSSASVTFNKPLKFFSGATSIISSGKMNLTLNAGLDIYVGPGKNLASITTSESSPTVAISVQLRNVFEVRFAWASDAATQPIMSVPYTRIIKVNAPSQPTKFRTTNSDGLLYEVEFAPDSGDDYWVQVTFLPANTPPSPPTPFAAPIPSSPPVSTPTGTPPTSGTTPTNSGPTSPTSGSSSLSPFSLLLAATLLLLATGEMN